MRSKARANGVSVHAITGSNCVLLAMDAEPAARQGLKGFAIRSENAVTGTGGWLRGFKFFESLVPNPQPGERRSTLGHPIQSFLWGDYSASPDQSFRYTVRPLYGPPENLIPGTDVIVEAHTESNDQGEHAIYFNRGAIPSQKFADLFGNQGPADENNVDAEDVQWLSRGLLEAALGFIKQARNSRFELRVAAYEFTYLPILEAFKRAASAGAEVKIVYEAGQYKDKGVIKDTSTTIGNREAVQAANLKNVQNIVLIERTKRRAIPHNKFMVLLENGHPIQVWTGSTNFTPSGFLGQTNVGHIIRDETVARAYLDYWDQLASDPEPNLFQKWCSMRYPHPSGGLPEIEITPIFSPRTRSKMLDWYGDRVETASQTVMLTAAFGVTRKLAERFNNDRDFLRFLIMERKNKGETQAMLERDKDTRIALGAALNKDAIKLGLGGHRLDEWFRQEEHFRKQGHIFYVHTKIMLIDLLTNDPLVFTGSANFSPNSLLSNDENMLLIRGNQAAADVYLTEFTRIFNHFYFRYIAQMLAKSGQNDPAEAAFLDPTDGWVSEYFKSGSYHARRRELFRAAF